LDQGSEGACVGHGVTQEAVARPVVVDFREHLTPAWAVKTRQAQMAGQSAQQVAQVFAFEIYHQAQRVDEWPGENYEGTSVAAGAKCSKDGLLWSEYRWTTDVDDFAVAVSRKGPGVIGIDWWSGMFNPDSDGYLNVTGRVAGGHCILVNGFNLKRDAFHLHNSWGAGWGINGGAWIRRTALRRLVDDGGELLLPVHRLP